MALLPYQAIERELLRMALQADNAAEGYPTSMGILQQSLAPWVRDSSGRDVTAALRRLHEDKKIAVWKWQDNLWHKLLPGHNDGEFFYDLHFYIRETTLTGPAFQTLEAQDKVNQAHSNSSKQATSLSRKVFVVHGHDEGVRETVARFLEQMGLEPIILHEQANQGKTIIEKVETYGDVPFAVVLLTPDDEGCKKDGILKPRARQNVVLELGYFVGRLGRNHVCALMRDEVELPSDFTGIVYEKFDASGGWKLALCRELKGAGFKVDLNDAVAKQ